MKMDNIVKAMKIKKDSKIQDLKLGEHEYLGDFRFCQYCEQLNGRDHLYTVISLDKGGFDFKVRLEISQYKNKTISEVMSNLEKYIEYYNEDMKEK
jgi:hypothetical protein